MRAGHLLPGSFSTHFSTHFDIAVYDFQTATTNVCNYVEGKMQNRRTKKQAEIKLKKFDSRRVHQIVQIRTHSFS